jgi:chromosomal replication initiator protein
MYLARRLTGSSLEAIGSGFGGRDHTTVMHGVRITRERLDTEPALQDDIDRLAAAITG